jgi:diguanylate cyclase (GGDEF)-like protein
VTTLMLGQLARWADFGRIWLTWWLGDAGGDMIVAPILLLWSANPRVRWRPRAAAEGAVVLVAAAIVGQVVFGGMLGPSRGMPLEFLVMPLCIWTAFRLGRRMSAVVVATVYLLAVRGTVAGHGPFAQPSANASLLLLQVFAGVLSLTTLVLAAVVAERRRSEEQLRQLSVTDPLTGLPNYRQLIDALEREVQRSQRTQNGFALVFVDVDGLKAINDRDGHLVGSRALCRVAEVLRRTSRAVDTPARYGGDEFALVLPFADEAAAAQVAARIVELLALDPEQPAVTVSAGLALYPQDGSSASDLLAAADRFQYTAKTRLKERAQNAGHRP